jgi:hypothetical protein
MNEPIDVSNVPIPKPDAVKFIGRTTRYFNEEGFQIEERIPVVGSFPVIYPTFIGFSVLRVEDGNGNVEEIDLVFPIRASSVVEAFSYYPINRDREKAKQLEKRNAALLDAAAPQILLPGG